MFVDELFVQTFRVFPGKELPDNGVSEELYSLTVPMNFGQQLSTTLQLCQEHRMNILYRPESRIIRSLLDSSLSPRDLREEKAEEH